MSLPLLLVISMLSALFATIITKLQTNDFGSSFSVTLLYNAVSGFISVIVFLIWGDGIKFSTFTVLLGLAFGLITALQTISRLKAVALGPMSLTQLFLSSSMLIPALSGVLFFSESISVLQIVGIVLTLFSFALAVDNKIEEKKASLLWITFCAIIFLSTGAIGVLQKVHQASSYKLELGGFLITAFLTSSVVSFVGTLALTKNLKANLKGKSVVKIILLSVLFGVFVAVNNKLNLFLSGKLDSALFFPLVNGGGLVLTTLSAIIVFREKLSVKKWTGFFVGLVAVLLLCNPF